MPYQKKRRTRKTRRSKRTRRTRRPRRTRRSKRTRKKKGKKDPDTEYKKMQQEIKDFEEVRFVFYNDPDLRGDPRINIDEVEKKIEKLKQLIGGVSKFKMTHKLSMMEDAEKDAQAGKTREAIRRMVENQGKEVTKKKSFYVNPNKK